jgi:hypothetical protein
LHTLSGAFEKRNKMAIRIQMQRSGGFPPMMLPGGTKTELPTVDFFHWPVEKKDHYKCYPKSLITFEEAVQISKQLGAGESRGTLLGRRAWFVKDNTTSNYLEQGVAV